MRHRQMVNVAKYALNSKVFSPLFTQACKLLPGYFFIFAEYINKIKTLIYGILANARYIFLHEE